MFHEYADLCLATGLDPHVFIGKPYIHEKFGTLIFDRQMADSMLYGLDYLRDLAAEPGATMYVERQVNLERWCGEGEFGTSDAGVINKTKRHITVFDWKYGMIPVNPHWNDQAILYTLGFWNDVAEALFEGLDPAEIDVSIVIEQPRAPGGGGVWHTNMSLILREGKKIILDAKAADDPNAERNPGAIQCQWCKAAKAGICPEFLDHQLSTFNLKLEELDDYVELDVPPPMPKVLTPTRRAYLLKFFPTFKRFHDDMHAAAYDDAMKGKPDPGMKLVRGRSPARKWRDEEKQKVILERRFGEDAYMKKLCSPAQVEERTGKKVFKETFGHHVLDEEPKPILVPSTDRRDPIPDVESRFDAAMNDDQD